MCKNLPGTFECSCADGFEFNGKQCVDTDECATDNPCSEFAQCVNKEGTFNTSKDDKSHILFELK